MNITHAYIEGLKSFKFSEIDSLEVDLVKPINIVMGGNGSGKSTFLQILSAYPPPRPDFEKNGKLIHHIEHEGKSYVLTTDFGNRHGAHSFKVEGKELNTSGVTGVQQELVEKYLGYTPKVKGLCHMEYDICRMGPSERKSFFISMNPVDLSLLLEKHKKSLSKIREFKNNLSMLHNRKVEVEAKLLDKDTLKATYRNKEVLAEQSSLLDKLMYALEQHIEQLNNKYKQQIQDYNTKVRNGVKVLPVDEIISYCKSLYKDLPNYREVSRTNVEDDRVKLTMELRSTTETISTISNSANEIKKEMEQYQLHLKNTMGNHSSSLEKELKELKELLVQYKVRDDLPVFTPALLQDAEALLQSNFKDLCLQFIDKPVQLWKPVKVRAVQSALDKLKYRIEEVKYKASQAFMQLKEIREELSSIATEVPDECILEHCKLRRGFVSKKQGLLLKQATLKGEHDRAAKYLAKREIAYEKLAAKYNEQIPFYRLWESISALRQQYNSLATSFQLSELFRILEVNPSSAIRRIEDGIINTKNHTQYTKISERIVLIHKELEVATKSNTTSVEFLTKVLKEKSDKLNSLLSDYDKYNGTKLKLLDNLDKISRFDGILNKLSSYEDTYENGAAAILAVKSIEYHNKLLLSCDMVKKDIHHQLVKIDSLLKEQEGLIARYDEEIVKWINKIELDKWKYELIEKSLSPNDGIPHGYMVSYLNNLIHNANYFISRVFSYRLHICPIDDTKSLDFTFPIEVGDVTVRDISKLSKGQREMVNLAWTLAILLQTKKLDKYPIFLDEIGSGIDSYHTQKLIECLHDLVSKKVIQQLFIVSHGSMVVNSFNDCDYICLRMENVLLPDREVNTYVRINS